MRLLSHFPLLPPLPVLAILLVLLSPLVHSLSSARSPSSSVSVAPPPPPPACFLTIREFRDHLPLTLWPRDTYYHTCPPGCLAAIDTTNPSLYGARLWGAFPYHQNSSACLAFIHAGIINATVGGGGYMYPFHRHEWTGDEKQTIFPYNTSLGVYSNAVQSLDVPPAWNPTPAGPDEYSISVATRTGLCFMQKRSAPFSPRAGHAHVKQMEMGSLRVAIIIAGHNATHYFNVSTYSALLSIRQDTHARTPTNPPLPLLHRSSRPHRTTSHHHLLHHSHSLLLLA